MPLHFLVNEQFEFSLEDCLEDSPASKTDIQPLGDGRFHILKNNRTYRGEVVKTDFANKTITLRINNNTYTVAISDEQDELVKRLGLATGLGQQMQDIKAPMPGMVLEVLVQPGQAIRKGDALLVLEAMKMENIIKARGDGMVKSVQVSKSQTVDKGAILIEME